ncbi:hypothetical protein PIB30_100847, partial [Stylosanthes scabra]|nr:hypothetical protein [Stylosanthes scabra]
MHRLVQITGGFFPQNPSVTSKYKHERSSPFLTPLPLRNPNTPNPNLCPTTPAVFRHPRRPVCRQKLSLSPPLQPEVVVPTSIAFSEVRFVTSYSISRILTSCSQERRHAVSNSIVWSASPWSLPLPAQALK